MLNARESKHGLPRNRHIYGNQLFKGLCKLVRSVAAGMSDSTDPLGYNLPGSSVLGILQARILEWVAMPSSRGSSQGSNLYFLHCRWILYCWATREALKGLQICLFPNLIKSLIAITCNCSQTVLLPGSALTFHLLFKEFSLL